MKVTSVKVYLKEGPHSHVRGYAEVVLDGQFAIHNMAIISGEAKYYVGMPYRIAGQYPSRKKLDVCHPITKECREMIEDAVLSEYERVAGEAL